MANQAKKEGKKRGRPAKDKTVVEKVKATKPSEKVLKSLAESTEKALEQLKSNREVVVSTPTVNILPEPATNPVRTNYIDQVQELKDQIQLLLDKNEVLYKENESFKDQLIKQQETIAKTEMQNIQLQTENDHLKAYKQDYENLANDFKDIVVENGNLKGALSKLKRTAQINVWLMEQHVDFVNQLDEMAEKGSFV